VRPIPAYKAGLYGLTENRQLSNFNSKQHSSPFTERGFLIILIKKTYASENLPSPLFAKEG